MASVTEFAASIKAKYPQYEGMDDTELAQKIVDKYPIYKDQVDFTAPTPPPPPPPEQPGLLSRIGSGIADAAKSLFSEPPPPLHGAFNPDTKTFDPLPSPADMPRQEIRTPAEVAANVPGKAERLAPRAAELTAGAEYEKEASARADAFAQAQKDAIAAGYGSDVERYAKDKSITIKPLLATPEQYAEEKAIAKGDAPRSKVAAATDVISSIQDLTSVPLAALVFGHTVTEREGKRVLGTGAALDEKTAVAAANAKPEAERTDDDNKIIAADTWKAKLGAAAEAIKADPSGAAKELLIGLLEEAPTYALTSAAGGELIKAAGSLYKGARTAARIAAVEKRVGAASEAAARFAQADETAAAVADTKAALVKPTLPATIGRHLAKDLPANVAAGEIQAQESGKPYDAAQLTQDLVATGAMAAGGSLFHALGEGRPLTAAEFADLQKAVEVAGIQDHPDIKKLLPSLVETSRIPDVAESPQKIRLSTEDPSTPAGDQIPGQYARGKITLFAGADPSTVTHETTHFLEDVLSKRAEGGGQWADLQSGIDDWDAGVRAQVEAHNKNLPEAQRIVLPPRNELFTQVITELQHPGSEDPAIAAIGIPKKLVNTFGELFGKYRDLGKDEFLGGRLTGVDADGNPYQPEPPPPEPAPLLLEHKLQPRQPTVQPPGIRRPLPDLEAEREAKAQAAFDALPPDQKATTPFALLPKAEQERIHTEKNTAVLDLAARMEANPLDPEFLPENLRNLTGRQRNTPTMRAALEEAKTYNLEIARKMREAPEQYDVPAGETSGGGSDLTVLGRDKGVPVETPAPIGELARAEARGVPTEEPAAVEAPVSEPVLPPRTPPPAAAATVHGSPGRMPLPTEEPAATVEPTLSGPGTETPKPFKSTSRRSPKTPKKGEELPQQNATSPPARAAAASPTPTRPLAPTMPREMAQLVLDGDVVAEKGKQPYATTEKGARALYQSSYFTEDGREHPVLYQVKRRPVTETPEFRKWFGDSKVVDDKGEPLVVYHGTASDVEAFRPSKDGRYGGGIYFWDDPARASSWAEGIAENGPGGNKKKAGGAPNVIPAYLSEGATRIPGGWIAHDPTQIKSIHNRGTFDATDPRILFQTRKRLPSGETPRVEQRQPPTEEAPKYAPPPAVPVGELTTPRAPGESVERWQARAVKQDSKAIREALNIAATQRVVGRGEIRAMLAKNDRELGRADAAFKEFQKRFDAAGTDNSLKSMDEWETGKTVQDPKAREFFAAAKDAMDQRVEKIRSLFPEAMQNLIENYFPHLWENPEKAMEWYARTRAPLEGDKAFLKQRVHATTMDGIASGLKPVSYNPVDLVLAKITQMDKFIGLNEFKNELDSRGWVRRVEAGGKPPVGFSIVNDPAFRRIGHGSFAVPEVIARDLNTYLSPGLYKYKAWQNIRAAQNIMLSARLGLSAFHAGFTTFDTGISHLDVALRAALSGDLTRAAKTLAESVISPIASPIRGRKLLQQFYGRTAADPNTAAVLDALSSGGSRGKMNPTDYTDHLAQFTRAVRARDLKTSAVKATGAAIEVTSRWITHHLVPWQKMASRVMLAKFELDRLAGQLGKEKGDYAGIVDAMHPDVLKQIMGDVTQQVDDRLGQLAYDNLFMNRAVKDISQATIQAVGWNIGTFNTIFGGVWDAGKMFRPDMMVGPLDKAGKIPPKAMARITGRLSYLVALNVGMGTLGAITQMMMSGKPPTELKDYFFPRTGRKNQDGSDERISFPGYMKDEFQMLTHPVSTAVHKLHPSLSSIAELVQNKDFYGVKIVNPEDPWQTQAADIAEHIAKSIEPYAIQGMIKNSEDGKSAAMTVLPFFGITPAPASVTRSKFQEFVADKISEKVPSAARTKEDVARTNRIRDAENSIRQGGHPDVSGLEPKDQVRVLKEAQQSVSELRFKRLSLEDKLKAYELATPDEKKNGSLRVALLSGGIRTQLLDLPEDQRKAALEKIKAIEKEK